MKNERNDKLPVAEDMFMYPDILGHILKDADFKSVNALIPAVVAYRKENNDFRAEKMVRDMADFKLKEMKDNLQNNYKLIYSSLSSDAQDKKQKAQEEFTEIIKNAINDNYIFLIIDQDINNKYSYQGLIIELMQNLEPFKSDKAAFNAFLNKVDLSQFKIQGLNINGFDFEGKDLTGAWIRFSDLRNINLQNANLTMCNLIGSNLKGANLKRCKFVDFDKLTFIHLTTPKDVYKNPGLTMLSYLYHLCESQNDKETIKELKNAIIADILTQFQKSFDDNIEDINKLELLVDTLKNIRSNELFSKTSFQMLQKEDRKFIDIKKKNITNFFHHEIKETKSQQKLSHIINVYEEKINQIKESRINNNKK